MVNVESRFIRTNTEETKRLSLWLVNRTKQDRLQYAGVHGWDDLAFGGILDDAQAEAFVQEVQQIKSAEIIFAPRLTMVNGQRAWVMDGRQDMVMLPRFDKPGQPKEKACLMTGTLLDVKATISADLRYAQLDLRPSIYASPPQEAHVGSDILAWLFSSKAVVSDPLEGIYTISEPVNPQPGLPGVHVTTLRTSVSVPDGGTVLQRVKMNRARLAGMKEGQDSKMEPVWTPVEGQTEPQVFMWLLVKAKIISFPSWSPVIKTRPPTTATLEKPAPIPSAFQRSFGPPSGHCFSSPLSGDFPSWLRPRQPGQAGSAALASEAMIISTQSAETLRLMVGFLVVGVGVCIMLTCRPPVCQETGEPHAPLEGRPSPC